MPKLITARPTSGEAGALYLAKKQQIEAALVAAIDRNRLAEVAELQKKLADLLASRERAASLGAVAKSERLARRTA